MDFCKEGEEEQARELGLDDPIPFSNSDRIEDLAIRAGLFASKNQARKNGYSGVIPVGYSEIGSRKNRMYIWNPSLGPDIYDVPGYEERILSETLGQ